jgi:uncharacterized protein (TIGR02266 family)
MSSDKRRESPRIPARIPVTFRRTNEAFEDLTAERRVHHRLPVKLRVTYQRINEFLQDYTRNISRGGMFIEASAMLDVGTLFSLELAVPSLKIPLAIHAQVQWVVHEEDAEWDPEELKPGMGVQFVYRSEKERHIVETTMETLIRRHLGPDAYRQLVDE